MGGTVKPLRVGVVGAGNISRAYLAALPTLSNVEVTAVADLVAARAEKAAASVDGARALPLGALLAADDVDLVLNLTIPAAHADVADAAIAAGKHVYGEKPLAADTGSARSVLDAASDAGLRVGCAPDTVLGTGVQTARAVLDADQIGAPVAATAFMVTPGHEGWHPDPDFYYQPGGGPLLDMGPYYLTALVTLLGPVRHVAGMSSTPRSTRLIGSGPRAGQSIEVNVATHVTGLLEHENGALSTLVMSFEVWAGRLPRIEIYGTEGTLALPNPNFFDGDVRLKRHQDTDWEVLTPVTELFGAVGTPEQHRRGLGVRDLVGALAGEPHRANAQFAFHTLEVLASFEIAQQESRVVALESSCERPEPRYAH